MKVNQTTAKQFKRLKEEHEAWEYSPEGIDYRFAGVHGIEGEEKRGMFFGALSKLPRKIVDYAVNYLFVDATQGGDNANYYDSKSFKKYRGVIRFEPGVWNKSLKKIEEIIAHEIAHAYLRHEFGMHHTRANELAADELASKWLGRKIDYYEKLFKKLEI